jgi:hypothetical protein
MKSSRKWFKPKKHTGWQKSMPRDERREKALKAHRGDKLATARSLGALANVTADGETERKAREDAIYFYVVYEKEQKAKKASQPKRRSIFPLSRRARLD